MTTEKFYFIRNGQQIGPIEAEQLAQENITPQTMVWRQGMEDWKEARLLPELDFLWQKTNFVYQGGNLTSVQSLSFSNSKAEH